MHRFFVKNILFIIAVNILVKPIWVFLIDRNVQNSVATGDYGTYQALMSLSIIFQTLLDFGITNYNSRTIAQNPGRMATLFPAMFSARLVLISVYLLLAFAGGLAVGYRGWELGLLIGVLLVQSLNSLVSFIRSNVSALHLFKTDGMLSITDRTLMIGICGVLLFMPSTFGRFKIEWFVIAQIFSYFIASLIGYLFLKRIGKIKLHFSFDKTEIFSIFKQSFPYALLIFQMSIYNRVDAMMIERMCENGKKQADIWAAAFRLLEVSNMFGLMFASMLLPLFGRMLSRKQNVQPIVKICVNMLLPASCVVAIASFFFAGHIMPTLYKASTPEYEIVFRWLMASFPAWCLMYVYSTLLTANGSLKKLNVIAFTGVVINLSLNFWLIPRYNALGGAITSFTTQTALSIIFILVASKSIKLPTSIRWILAHAGFIAFCIIVLSFIIRYLPIHWSLQLSLFGVISLLMMFAFRFITINGIKQIANSRNS